MRRSSPRLLRLPGCAVRAGAGRERKRAPRWRRWRCVAAAAVGCAAAALTGVGPAWAQVAGDLRLQDGSTALDGRLEVYLSDDQGTFQWGTVCKDEFGAAEVTVVCNQLGHPSVGSHYYDTDNYAGVRPASYRLAVWLVTPNEPAVGDELNLELRYLGTQPSAARKAAIAAAARFWEGAITRGLPDLPIPTSEWKCAADDPDLFGEYVDDLLIYVRLGAVEGPRSRYGWMTCGVPAPRPG
jgi:hypothetical protein